MRISDLLLVATTMTADKREMTERITRIARPRRTVRAALIAALALTAAVCAVTFTGAKAREPVAPEAPSDPPEAESAGGLRVEAAAAIDKPAAPGEGTPEEAAAEGALIVPFTGILGLDGWYEEYSYGDGGYSRRYRSSDGTWFAGSYGKGIDDYVLDLDGDSVTELICNDASGLWTDVTVYCRNGGLVEEGILLYEELELPGWTGVSAHRGPGEVDSRYDPERGLFVVTYATADGEAERTYSDYGAFDFDFYGGTDLTAVRGAYPYREALLDGETFYSEDAGEWLLASDVGATAFAVVNLGGLDYVDEVLLRLPNENTLVLHCDTGGDVHGWTMLARDFQNIKTDGTFRWAGGSGYWGYATLRFTGTGCETDNYIWRDRESYYVDRKSAEKAAFWEAIEREDAKPNVIWYDFTEENLTAVLGENDR